MNRLFPLAAFLLLAGVLPPHRLGAAVIPTSTLTLPIAGNRPGVPARAHILGPLPASVPLRLVVGLAPHRQDILDFLTQASRHGAPLMGHTALTPARFAALFGLTVAEQDAVIAYLTMHGLRVTRTYRDRLLLDVTGTAGAISSAFATPLVRYRDRYGHVHYANTVTPRLPAALAPLVKVVVGLCDTPPPRHLPLPRSSARPPHPRGRPVQAVPAPPPGLFAPDQIRTNYDITPIYTSVFTAAAGISQTVAITGTGETIALYELSPYHPEDIAAYDRVFGLQSPPPVTIPVDGGATDTFEGKGTSEATMDIELAQAVAPGAQILVYSGSSSGNDTTGADDTYARIINDGRAQVLSTSWGQCEDPGQPGQVAEFMLLHTLFAQAIAQGMTILAPSGDAGAYDCQKADGSPDTSKQTVDYPASDPYVIAVGGTAFAQQSDGLWREEAWPESGGGRSIYFAQPSWQSGPGVANALSNGRRQVPDVALDAGTNYAVWVDGGWLPVNGTSAGPPVWAAILALTNQARYAATAVAHGQPLPSSCATLHGLGDIHPELYQLGPTPAFRDIVSGPGNGVAMPGPGWDYVTGWGVPDASALLRALIALPALAPPAPGPCRPPIATPTPSPTPRPTVRPTQTPLPRPTALPSGLTLSVIPGTVRAGATVLLQVRAPLGRGYPVTFEILYPHQRPQRLYSRTDSHGVAGVRVRIMQARPKHGTLFIVFRATLQERSYTLTRWVRVRLY